MPDPLVRLDLDDGVGVVRLDRPPANAISLRLALDLLDTLREAGSRDDVGAIVLWGGPKLLAAGADIKEMVDHGPEEIREQVGALGDACDLLEALPKLSIAVITGFALGGGFELSLACDLRYAAQDAKVGQPEVAIGVMPGAGGTQRMTWLAGLAVARDLTYTGRQVDADEAKELGLVDRVYPTHEVFEAAVRDARRFARGPRGALAAAKEALREAVRTPGAAGIAREKELFIALFGSHDQREGMRAFIEKRPPSFQGN
jgi:enoyl-CoA hydratase/carnithine racemase